MEPTIPISILGILVFGTLAFFAFKFANGKWKMPDAKKAAYQNWAKQHGKKMKIGLIIISVIYGVAMSLQLLILAMDN